MYTKKYGTRSQMGTHRSIRQSRLTSIIEEIVLCEFKGRQFMKKLIPLVLLGCVSMGTVYANPIVTTVPTKDTVVATTIAQKMSKEEFVKYVTAPKTITYLHKSDTLLNWIIQDMAYAPKQSPEQIKKEIQEMYRLIEAEYDNYIMFNKTKVYGMNTVAYLDALESAITMRQEILNGKALYDTNQLRIGGKLYKIHDKTNNTSSYSNKLINDLWLSFVYQVEEVKDYHWVPTDAEIQLVAEGVYEALNDYTYPNGLTDNLTFYLSPYYLEGYLGFTTGSHLVGREEQVLIAAAPYETTKQTVIDTVIHELGHVFETDMVGIYKGETSKLSTHNSERYTQISKLFTEYDDKATEERDYEIGESFAEHFRTIIQKKNNKPAKVESYPQKKQLYTIINNLISKYSVDTSPALPELKIAGVSILSKEFNSSMPYIFEGTRLQCKLSDWNLAKRPLTYKLIKRDDVNNSAIPVKDGKVESLDLMFNIDTGHYALIFYEQNKTIRFNEFDFTKK